MGCYLYRTEILELVERICSRDDAIKVNSHIIGLTDDLEHSRVELEAKDKRIAELERVAQNLINEYCEKGGSEGFHYPAEQQSCFLMRGAMRVLSNTKGEG